MKKIKNLTLILASFLAGIVFIVRCGGDVKTLAEEIAAAISFDNTATGSSLTSTTVQGAIEEIAETIPFVRDANGNKIGMLIGTYTVNEDPYLMIWDLKAKTTVVVDFITGTLIGMPSGLLYTSTDCTGTAYYPYGNNKIKQTSHYISGASAPIYMNEKLYTYNVTGSKIAVNDIQSYQVSDEAGSCFAFSIEEAGSTETMPNSKIINVYDDYYIPTLIEAKEISITPYTGPLSIY